jgi:hypothetical protein
MLLTPADAQLFFKLHRSLMLYVNERLQVLPNKLASPEEFSHQSLEARLKVRNALLEEVDLIESFVDQNPAQLATDELDIVLSWRHLENGQFYIYRELKKYTVFLSTEKEPIAYGVTALTQPFEELVGPYLPVMTDTVLLPFKDKIVYDGLLLGPGVSLSFGPGIRRMLNESYQEAKNRYGIVTSLPVGKQPPAQKSSKPKQGRKSDDVHGVHRSIVGMTDEFCREHLNDEYAMLCRKLAEKLARKRPSPLLSGKPNAWACGIVRTIGMLNFLGDKSQKPYMKISDISQAFGISEATASARTATIKKLLDLSPLDPEWSLPSRADENPLTWMLSVNGFVMDLRHAPREAQEAAFEQGLIPYIPADRDEKK